MERIFLAKKLAKEAGGIAQKYFNNYQSLTLDEKSSPQDMVTEADREVEDFMIEVITQHFPEDGIFGEERGIREGNGNYWLMDPIDGTANFVRGLAYYCVSISFMCDNHIEFGVIYDPILDELFYASVGEGAFLNDTKIEVENPKIEQSVVGLGRSERSQDSEYPALISKLFAEGIEYRRLGAGALSLAHVAVGRLSAYYEAHMNPWDATAGLLIAKEAGADTVEYFAKEHWKEGGIVYAASPSITEKLISMCLNM